MFAHVILVLSNTALCLSFAAFQMFPGFDANVSMFQPINRENTVIKSITNSPDSALPPSNCPENENPLKLGAFDIPTERELVLLVKKTLTGKYSRFSKKVAKLERAVKEALRTADLHASECVGNPDAYNECVTSVNHHCASITKKLVTSVERRKRSISSFSESHLCTMATSTMTIDPLDVIKKLAVEEVTLKFALPAFLRLLGDCLVHCSGNHSIITAKETDQRLNDQQYLVNHIVTKNLRNFIKDSR